MKLYAYFQMFKFNFEKYQKRQLIITFATQ